MTFSTASSAAPAVVPFIAEFAGMIAVDRVVAPAGLTGWLPSAPSRLEPKRSCLGRIRLITLLWDGSYILSLEGI